MLEFVGNSGLTPTIAKEPETREFCIQAAGALMFAALLSLTKWMFLKKRKLKFQCQKNTVKDGVSITPVDEVSTNETDVTENGAQATGGYPVRMEADAEAAGALMFAALLSLTKWMFLKKRKLKFQCQKNTVKDGVSITPVDEVSTNETDVTENGAQATGGYPVRMEADAEDSRNICGAAGALMFAALLSLTKWMFLKKRKLKFQCQKNTVKDGVSITPVDEVSTNETDVTENGAQATGGYPVRMEADAEAAGALMFAALLSLTKWMFLKKRKLKFQCQKNTVKDGVSITPVDEVSTNETDVTENGAQATGGYPVRMEADAEAAGALMFAALLSLTKWMFLKKRKLKFQCQKNTVKDGVSITPVDEVSTNETDVTENGAQATGGYPVRMEADAEAAGALMFAALLSLTKWMFLKKRKLKFQCQKNTVKDGVSITPVDEVSTNETDVTENGAQATGGYPVRMEADAEAAGALMFAALLSLTKWMFLKKRKLKFQCQKNTVKDGVSITPVDEVSTNETDVTENGAQATGGYPVRMEADAEAAGALMFAALLSLTKWMFLKKRKLKFQCQKNTVKDGVSITPVDEVSTNETDVTENGAQATGGYPVRMEADAEAAGALMFAALLSLTKWMFLKKRKLKFQCQKNTVKDGVSITPVDEVSTNETDVTENGAQATGGYPVRMEADAEAAGALMFAALLSLTKWMFLKKRKLKFQCQKNTVKDGVSITPVDEVSTNETDVTENGAQATGGYPVRMEADAEAAGALMFAALLSLTKWMFLKKRKLKFPCQKNTVKDGVSITPVDEVSTNETDVTENGAQATGGYPVRMEADAEAAGALMFAALLSLTKWMFLKRKLKFQCQKNTVKDGVSITPVDEVSTNETDVTENGAQATGGYPVRMEADAEAAGALMFAALLSLTKWMFLKKRKLKFQCQKNTVKDGVSITPVDEVSTNETDVTENGAQATGGYPVRMEADAEVFEEEEVEVPVSKEHRERWRLIKLREPRAGSGFQFPVSITPVDEVSTNETDVTENGAQATGGYPVRMEADAEAAGALMFAALLSLTKWMFLKKRKLKFQCQKNTVKDGVSITPVDEVSTNETDVTENGAQATGGYPVRMEADAEDSRNICGAAGALMFAALLSLTKWMFLKKRKLKFQCQKNTVKDGVSITPVDEVSTNETDVTENGAQATGGYPVRMEADAEAAGALMFAALLTHGFVPRSLSNLILMVAVSCDHYLNLLGCNGTLRREFEAALASQTQVLQFLSIASSGSSWLRSTFAVKFDSYGGCFLRSLPQPFRLYSDNMIFQRLQREFEAALASQTQGGYGVLDDQIFTSGLYGICTGGLWSLSSKIIIALFEFERCTILICLSLFMVSACWCINVCCIAEFDKMDYHIASHIVRGYQKRQEAVSLMFETAQLRLYAFDVHCNSFFTLFIVLYAHGFVPLLLSNVILMVAVSCYHYLNFLGCDGKKSSELGHLQTEFEAAPASQMQGRVASTVDAVLLSHPDTKHLGALQYAVNNLDFLLQFMQQNQFLD
ncbi:hypothetical protein L1987_77917 [Smallanthus sonchifolius]|uniref:Uncharacterized protein n=1 Tax=Smallanthus sonchifolius TaxID=185202 RepID=A0ACB8ZBF0_9ASTR|nr:hypothetical protein L1987_77917 [Smallanthus sonchifolius]